MISFMQQTTGRPSVTIEAKPQESDAHNPWGRVERHGDHVVVSCLSSSFIDTERVQWLHRVLGELLDSRVGTLDLDMRRISRADTKLLAVLVIVAGLARKKGSRFVIHATSFVQALIQIYGLEGLLTKATRFVDHRELLTDSQGRETGAGRPFAQP